MLGKDKMVAEQRLTKRLTDYWERLRDGGTMPVFEKFRSTDIPDMWDFCFLVAVDLHDPARKQYRYEYMGTQITEAYGKDLTGQRVSSIIQTLPGVAILKKIDVCVDGKQLLNEEGKFINEKSKVVKYRGCMLPFGQEVVSHVVVGLSWKAF